MNLYTLGRYHCVERTLLRVQLQCIRAFHALHTGTSHWSTCSWTGPVGSWRHSPIAYV